MTLTRSEARDEILTVLKTAWDPTGLAMLWPNVDASPSNAQDGTKTEAKGWARATLEHDDRGQSSLSNYMGQKTYTAIGTLTVQIFTPIGEGLSNADSYAILIQNGFDGAKTPGGVWFKKVNAREIGPDGTWFQTNVVIQFEYDEVK